MLYYQLEYERYLNNFVHQEEDVIAMAIEKQSARIFSKFQNQLNGLVEEAKQTKPKEIKAMRIIFNQHLEVLRRYLEGEGLRAVTSFDSQISKIEKKEKTVAGKELIQGYNQSELLLLCEKSFKDILQFSLDSYLHTLEDFVANAHPKNFSSDENK